MRRTLLLLTLAACGGNGFVFIGDDAAMPDSSDDTGNHVVGMDGGDATTNPDGQPQGDGGAKTDASDGATLPYKRVFMWSGTHDGALGGLSGADAVCQSAANAASLGGSWKAWLSSSLLSASGRLSHSSLPYQLLDGTVIASNWTSLTAGTLAISIDVDQNKAAAPAPNQTTNAGFAWTGTNTDGTTNSWNCSDWTSNSSGGYGTAGMDQADASFCSHLLCQQSDWTDWTISGCSTPLSLYCIEQ